MFSFLDKIIGYNNDAVRSNMLSKLNIRWIYKKQLYKKFSFFCTQILEKINYKLRTTSTDICQIRNDFQSNRKSP